MKKKKMIDARLEQNEGENLSTLTELRLSALE